MTPEEAIAFWARVQVGGPEECWPFVGIKRPGRTRLARVGDYGSFPIPRVRSSPLHSNRVAYAIAHGSAPEEAVIRHSCDRKECCNPAHLVAGTHLENVKEAWARGPHRDNTGRY